MDRIVILNDSSVARGGATALAIMAARDLAARGHRVTYLCGDAGDGGALAAAGVEVQALGGARLLESTALQALRRGVSNPDARRMVADWIAAHDTPGTVYHVHGWAQILSPELFAALSPVAGRVLIHAHDMFLACPNGVYMDYPRHEVCARVPLSASCLAANCDKRSYAHKLWRVARQARLRTRLDLSAGWGGIIAIHPEMVPRLVRAGYPTEMIETVRNPVEPFRSTRIAAEDNAGLVYVGRLEPDKGVGELVAAAARTGQALTLVGDGPMRAELEAEHPDLRITGWLPRAHIGPVVARARALVMPSRHPEPFGLVVPEALASGLPVVLSDIALMAEEVARHGLGLTVNVFDPRTMDSALSRVRDMAASELRGMSLRGFSGQPALGQSRRGWIDALETAYGRLCPVAAG